ncbi:DUF2703 domain-containing protein [Oscillospiraceae bacterium WX1]
MSRIHLGQKKNARGCSCGSDVVTKTILPDKKLVVDFLFLDLQTCDRCLGADDVLNEAIQDVEHVLSLAGYEIVLRKIEITDERMAEKYKFLASPTIRLNGTDICLDVKENACGTCGDISGQSTDCRVFVFDGKDYEVPPKAMLIDALLRAVYGPVPQKRRSNSYVLPDNLKRFFAGKWNKAEGLCCGITECSC